MPETLKNISNQISAFWAKFTKRNKILFIALIVGIVLIAAISVYFLNRTEYAVLYTGLDSNESGEIYNKLVEGSYDVKTDDSGNILVPESEENEIRMNLAAEGYPKSGLNYDVFQSSAGFGTTEYEKQKYMQFQLQDRLQETIKSIDVIEDAIVTLTIPDNNSVVLKGDKRPATASVLLKIKNNADLSEGQVNAIVELVEKSVPGLTDENVSIIDGNMKILNRSNNDSSKTVNAGTQFELEHQVAQTLQEQVLNLLEPIFGYGKVVTGVNVRLDFDSKTTESVKFEPVLDDEGIAVSLTELEETSRNSQNGGVAGQDPNGGAPQYVEGDGSDVDYSKVSRTVNYEVNETRELIEKAEGQIKDLSVSVVIDDEGVDEELIEQVQDVVAGAVGIDNELVVVKSMVFNGTDSIDDIFENAKQASADLVKGQRNRNILILAILGIVLVLIILLVVKLVKAKNTPVIDYTVGDESDLENIGSETDEEYIPEITFTGDKNTYKDQINKFYRNNPDIVIQIIRNWLNEE